MRDDIIQNMKNIQQGEILLGMDYARKWQTLWCREVTSANYSYRTTSIFPVVCHFPCPDCDEIVKEPIIIVILDEKEDTDHISAFIDEAMAHLEQKIERFSEFKSAKAFYRLTQSNHSSTHIQ